MVADVSNFPLLRPYRILKTRLRYRKCFIGETRDRYIG